jgi:hypothetical protein
LGRDFGRPGAALCREQETIMDADKTLIPANGPTEPTLSPAEPAEPGAPGKTSRPQVTFRGNSYDLVAVVAATVGGLMAVSCLTCNMIWYCMPVGAIVLGLVGLFSTKEAVDADRTRLLSWIGVAGGAFVVLLLVLGIVAYVALIGFAIFAGGNSSLGR